jgi:hypothetical protein
MPTGTSVLVRWPHLQEAAEAELTTNDPCARVRRQAWLTWRGGQVLRLAQEVEARGAWGTLPVVADALEEAGCDDAAILGHLRDPGPHARGCWALDLVLGKD